MCCGSWGRRELGTTERLNWTDSVPSTFVKTQNTAVNRTD